MATSRTRLTGILLVWLFCLAAMLSAATPATADGLHAVSLRLVTVAYSQRQITFEVAYDTGTASVSLANEGMHLLLTSSAVSTQTAGSAVLDLDVSGSAGSSALQAVAFSEEPTEIARSQTLQLDYSAYVPRIVSLRLRSNQAVGRALVLRGYADYKTRSVSVVLDGSSVLHHAVTPAADFTLPSVPLRYGRSTVRVVSENAWGSRTTKTLYVWNLGRTHPSSHYIIIDKSDFRLYLLRDGCVAARYWVAIGTPYTPTPQGFFSLRSREWLGYPLTAWGILRMRLYRRTPWGPRATGYYIHGTNNPDSIGTPASHGCVRMYNSDVVRLSRLIHLGITVKIRR